MKYLYVLKFKKVFFIVESLPEVLYKVVDDFVAMFGQFDIINSYEIVGIDTDIEKLKTFLDLDDYAINDEDGLSLTVFDRCLSDISARLDKVNRDSKKIEFSPLKNVYRPQEIVYSLMFVKYFQYIHIAFVDNRDTYTAINSDSFGELDIAQSFVVTHKDKGCILHLFEVLKVEFDLILRNSYKTDMTVDGSNNIIKSIKNDIDSKKKNYDWYSDLIIAKLTPSLLKYETSSLPKKNIRKVKKEYYTSSEVCTILGISTQTLSDWRKLNKIEFKQLSERKFFYKVEQIDSMKVDNKLKNEPIQNSIPMSKIDRLKNAMKSIIPQEVKHAKREDIQQPNNDEFFLMKLKNYTKIMANHIHPDKITKHYYFMNFANIKLSSSPQVMINNSGQLQDKITSTIYCKTAEETMNYLESLTSSGLKPKMEYSDKKLKGFELFYLDNALKNF